MFGDGADDGDLAIVQFRKIFVSRWGKDNLLIHQNQFFTIVFSRCYQLAGKNMELLIYVDTICRISSIKFMMRPSISSSRTRVQQRCVGQRRSECRGVFEG